MNPNLSEDQKKIVYYNEGEGALLVEASAGSGKTRVLTERVRYLLTEKKGNFRVLCLTFTNKAADEMKERLKQVKDITERAFIGTIHSFCSDVIKSKRHELGMEDVPHIFERTDDRKKILEQVLLENAVLKKHYENKMPKDQQDLLNKCLDFISVKKRELTIISDDTFEYNGWTEERLILFKTYNQLLKNQNAIDYDDILLLAYRIFKEHPATANLYRRLYKYILIDEAQDLNYAQYEVIRAICGDSHRNVLMVGDPNQAIYGFNGSDKKYMQVNFIRDFNAEKRELKENYRSSKQVISYANLLMPNSLNGKFAAIEGEAKTYEFENEEDEAKWIIIKIKELLDVKTHKDIEGDVTLEKIAVLARNRYVFKKLEVFLNQDIFLKNRFFYKKTAEAAESESDFVNIFDLGTRIISNPSDELHFAQICNFFKINHISEEKYKSGLQKLLSLKDKINDISLQQVEFLEKAWTILNDDVNKFSKALEVLQEYADNHLKSDEDDSERELILSDIKYWKEVWITYIRQVSPDSKSLSNFRRHLALGISHNSKKKSGLTLGTVHSVKGLEYDIVFLMGMTEGIFPDYRALKQRGKAVEEEKNNAFVAITRAKRLLYITFPKTKLMAWGDLKKQKKSQFIENFDITTFNSL